MRLSFTSDWKPAARCPAAWHAERVARTWTPDLRACFATGSLFHAGLLTPDRIPAVYAEYGDLLTLTRASTGFVKGDPNNDARETLADAEYCRALPGVADWLAGAVFEKEVLFELDGVEWVCHIDLQNAGTILDAKTCRDLEGREWSEAQRRKVPWHVAALYWYQLAVYRRAKRAEAGAVGLIAVQHRAKKVPAVRIITPVDGDYDLIDAYADEVEASMRHPWRSPATGKTLPPFVEMLDSAAVLPRCESLDCDYCVTTGNGRVYPYAADRGRGV